MKQKLLNSFKLRVCLLVAVLCAGFTSAWGETVSFIFTGESANCNAVSGTVSSISYATGKTGSATATAYNSTNGLVLYGVTSGGGYFNTTTAINGSITNISVTTNNKKNSPKYTVYGSTNGSTWTQIGEQTNGGSTESFDTSAGYTYVKIENTTAATAQLGVNSIIITYSVAAPAYTITAQSNNDSYGTVSLSGSVITASPNSGYRYANPAYTVSPENSATVSQEGNEFTVTPSANTTVTINFEAITTYTVTLGDDSSTLTEVSVGAGVELPSRNAVGDYTFAGWSTTNVTEETTTAPTIITTDDTYHPTANITLHPVYTKIEGSGSSNVVDELNRALTGVEGTSYTDWSGKTGASGAVYAGFSAGSNESIQLRTNNNNSGIVTTTSGGKAKKVSITWNSNTTDGRSVNVYGSNSAYNGADDLYSNDYQGTLLGTISYSSNADLTIDDDYEYIGIRSSNGALYLTKVEITWAINGTTYYTSAPSVTERVAQPTITIEDGVFVSSKLVTITTETPDAAIQYSTDDGNTWTNYSEPFSINATTTIQAKATKSGMDDSHVAEATFTKETVLVGLSALVAQTNTSDATYYVSLTNAQVTWANESIGYMEDSNAGVYLYNVTPTANLVYNGIFSVTYQVYNSMPEIKSITAVEGSTAAGSAKAATVMTVSALDAAFDANLGRQIQINGFTIPSSKELTSNIALYENSPYSSVTVGTTYNLVGYPFYAKVSGTVTKQFRITSAVEKVLLENTITGIDATYTVDLANNEDEVDLSDATATSGATVQYEVTSSTIDANDYEFTDGVLTVIGNGTITIRAYVNADSDYNGAEKIVIVTVVGNPTIGYDGADESTAYGTPYVVDADLIWGGNITLSSSNTAVATVDGLTITPVAVGSTTITINTADANIWHAGEATFTLNVTQPEGLTTAPSSVVTTTFTDKNLNYEEGGIDWTASTDASSFESSNYARGVQFGAAVGQFTLTATGKNVTKVSMVLSTNGTGNAVQVNVDGESFTTTYGEIDPNNVLNLTSGMNKETVEFTGTAGNAVTITVDDSNKSVYIKSITLYEEADPITVTLNATTGYATYCSEYPLDFSDATDFSAWEITGINGSEITFNQITGTVKGGTGVFLKGTAGATITLTSAASTTELSNNLLEGTLAPTYVSADQYFGLSGQNFVKVNAGTVPAGKALLPANEVPAEIKAFTFVFESVDGIKTVEKVSAEQAAEIFNLAGQRLQKAQRGVNIINGKKVLVK